MLLIYLMAVNILTFLLFGVDKQRARHKRQRIPEKKLLGAALAGGTLGALTGIYFFRHKTRRIKFTMGIPLIMFGQLVLATYIHYYFNI